MSQAKFQNINHFHAHLPWLERDRILERYAVGSLLDEKRSPIHRVGIDLLLGFDKVAQRIVTEPHEALVAGGYAVMEMDGKPVKFIGNIFGVHGLPGDASKFYADPDRLLPFQFRHQEHAGDLFAHEAYAYDDAEEDARADQGNIVAMQPAVPLHLIRATFTDLGQRREDGQQADLLVENGRRIVGLNGQPVRDAGTGKLLIDVPGYKIVACEPLRPQDSAYYKPREQRYARA